MAVRIETQLWTDPRIRMLAKSMDLNWLFCIGPLAIIWEQCTQRGVESLLKKEVDAITDLDGFANQLVSVGLADDEEDHVRIKGTKERCQWLEDKRKTARLNGAKGGRPKSKKTNKETNVGLGIKPTPNLVETQVCNRTEHSLTEHSLAVTEQNLTEPSKARQGIRSVPETLVLYLNEQAGTRFRAKTHAPEIERRLAAEQASAADARLVIDFKCHEWLGNGEMEKNLNPTTLFRPANFARYLDQARAWEVAGRKSQEPTHNRFGTVSPQRVLTIAAEENTFGK